MSNPAQAQLVVDLAKDTILFLSHLNNTTNLYRNIQVFYHQFLASAIAVLFLASVHQPVRFSAVCREEFYLALDLVKDLSARSWVSQRLWRTIRGLKDIAPRFGLNPDDDRHSSAAMGMIGLARAGPNGNGVNSNNNNNNNNHNKRGAERTGSLSSTHHRPHHPHLQHQQHTQNQHQQQPQQHQNHHNNIGNGGPPPNGLQLQSEMSRIFEGYVGLNGFQYSSADDGSLSHQLPSPESAGIYGGDGGLFSQFKEMF